MRHQSLTTTTPEHHTNDTREAAVGHETDDALFERWLDGDEAAFRIVFERLAPMVLGIARRHGLSDAEGRDVVQETFFAVHRSAADFRRGARVRPWLFTIAYNAIRQRLRAGVVRREQPLESAPDPVAAVLEPQVDRGAVVGCVRAALERLPVGQREVLVLHWLERLPFAAVAARLGTSEGAARVRAHRGYETLRRWLREDACLAEALEG